MIRALTSSVGATIALAWPAVLLAGGTCVLADAGLASPARVLFLVAAIVVAIRLERRDRARYVSFVFWLWFLAPFVRRIADLAGGWQEPSLVLLAPYMASAIAVPPLMHRWLVADPDTRTRPGPLVIFLAAALGVGLGVPTGAWNGLPTAALETLNWLLPVAFGLYVATQAADLHRIEAAMARTFGAAALLSAAYGVYQFTRPPLWDINWMLRSGMTTIGRPEPFAVRVFGTMHSPGVFSAFLVVALVIWLGRPRVAGMCAAGVAAVALLLSQVRSSWFALVVGALLVVAALRPAQRIRVGVLTLVVLAGASAALVTDEMRQLVSGRVSTMERLDDDESAVARLIGHRIAFEFLAEHPWGAGIGQTDRRMEEYISMRDSLVASTVVQFGLLGTALYAAGITGMAWLLWTYYRRALSVQGAAFGAAGLGLLAAAGLSVVTAGPIGMCVWTFTGLAVGDRDARRLARRQADEGGS